MLNRWTFTHRPRPSSPTTPIRAIPPRSGFASFGFVAALESSVHQDFEFLTDLIAFLGVVLVVALVLGYRRRLRAETRLDEAEQRIHLAAESADLGFWEWSAADNRLWLSERARRHFGIRLTPDVTREALMEQIDPADRTAFQRCFAPRSKEEPHFEFEVRVSTPGQAASRWIVTRGQAHFDASGHMDKVLAVSLDCTERRNGQSFAEQQRNHLAHVTRVATLGQLGASLSHEIMQPLTAILSNAQAAKHHLSHEKVDLFELNSILNDVIADDRRAAEIVHHLRGMVRKSAPNLAPVALTDVIREVADLLHSDFVQRGITLNLEVAPDLPRVQGDRVQLQQVMLNLLMNAADAVAANPVAQRIVWVRTNATSAATIELIVADRGAGFSAERISTAFAPFQSSKPNGLGIGLWISRAIVENHLGQITLSNHLMGGAVVTISLPAISNAKVSSVSSHV